MRILATRQFSRALIGMLGTGEMLVRSWHVVAYWGDDTPLPTFRNVRTAAALSQLMSEKLADALLEAGPTLAKAATEKTDMGEVWRAIHASLIEAGKQIDPGAAPEGFGTALQIGLCELVARDGRPGIDLAETVNSTNPIPLYQRIFAWVTSHLTALPRSGNLIKVALVPDMKLEATEVTALAADDDLTEENVAQAMLALILTMDRHYIDPGIKLQGAAIEASRLRSGMIAQIAKVSNRIHEVNALKLPFGLPSFEMSAELPSHPLLVKAAREIVLQNGLSDAVQQIKVLLDALPQQCVNAMTASLDPKGKDAAVAATQLIKASEIEIRKIHADMEKAASHIGQANQSVAENLLRATDEVGHLESVLAEFRKSTTALKKQITARLKDPEQKWPEGRTEVTRAVTNILTSRYDYP